MKLRKIAASIGFAAALGMTATSANAALQFFFPQTNFEDDNIDFFAEDVNQDGLIGVGDRLVSVFEIIRTFDPYGSGQSVFGPGDELTGIIDATVASATQVLPGQWLFTFEPTPGGILSSPGAIAGAWYQPAGADLDLIGQNCTSLNDCVNRATNGNLLFEVGYAGDPDEYFALLGSNDPAIVLSGDSNTALTFGSYAFSILVNNTGLTFGPVPCNVNIFGACSAGDGAAQLVGSGSILGGDGLNQNLRDNGAFGRSDFDFGVRPQRIPEPGSLALLGLGLFGLAYARRRKS